MVPFSALGPKAEMFAAKDGFWVQRGDQGGAGSFLCDSAWIRDCDPCLGLGGMLRMASDQLRLFGSHGLPGVFL